MLGPYYTGDTPSPFNVTVLRDGAEVDLSEYSAAEIVLLDPDNDSVTWGSGTIDEVDNVVSVESPAVSPFSVKGLYALYVKLTLDAGGVETFFIDSIRVFKLGEATGWATPGDVANMTGETVTESDVALAQDVIELHAGRTFAGSSVNNSIRAKDLVWLKKAVVFQACWMPNQPGYLNRHTVKEVDQDGVRIVYAGGSEPSNPALIALAPLANRALKNLSWMRTRSILFRPPSYEGDHPSYGDYKRNDDHPGWRPM